MPAVRTAIQVVPSLAPPPPVAYTRMSPGAVAVRQGALLPKPQAIWGRVPTEAVEGHEPDPYYDVRWSGLSQGGRSLNLLSARRSSGLGQGDEAELGRLYLTLDEWALAVQDGLAAWKKAGNAGEVELGERFAGTWAYAMQELGAGHREPARRLVPLLSTVKRWRDLGRRAGGAPPSTTLAAAVERAPTSGSWWSSFFGDVTRQGGEALSTTFQSSVGRWVLPAAAGVVLLLVFLRRR